MTPAKTAGVVRIALVGTAMALCYTVQQSVMPALLPLAVRLGMDELRMGAVITVSGSALLLSNPFWTSLVRRWGTRPVLISGLAGIMLSSIAFAVVVRWPPEAVEVGFAFVLMTRGALFGLSLAAVAVAGAAALLTDVTAEQRRRVAAVIAAAPGAGIVAGPMLDTITGPHGLIVLLLVPLVPLAMATILVVWRSPGGRPGPSAHPTLRWGPLIRRVRTDLLLIVSLLLLVAATQVNAGFLLRDRTGSSADEAGRAAAWVSFAGGLAFLLVQAAVVAWPALSGARALRLGLAFTLVGIPLLAFGATLTWILLGALVTALGIGVALPACYERVSRAAGETGHAQAAAIIATAAGAAFAIGPVMATGLYTVGPAVPFVVISCLLLVGSLRCVRMPR